MWTIQLFGELRAQHGDHVITRGRTKKCEALFGYLAYHRQREHPRELLVQLFWPDCEPRAGRNNLSKELCWLRDQLEPPGVPADSVLAADNSFVRLNPDAVTTDLSAFLAALKAGDQAPNGRDRAHYLAQAVRQYRGELLARHYDPWILEARQWLAEKHLRALRDLVALMREAGDLPQAIDYAHQVLELDPVHEEACCDLMRLYAAAGRPDAALRQVRELERSLRQQLETVPSPATRALADELMAAQLSARSPVIEPSRPLPSDQPWEPDGGAMPVDSPYYVARQADTDLHAAIERRDSIVLLKGARQMGKTSLLARGLDQARKMGSEVILTDLQMLNAPQLQSVEALFLALAQWIAAQIDGIRMPQETWNSSSAPSINFELYLRREVLGTVEAPIVWGLDEVDRLFPCSFGSEVFGLFRAWYNRRALDPAGPWDRLTVVMAYATEAHLFISDLHQSPFNVGTRLRLDDFTLEQVADLNRRFRCPLRTDAEVARFHDWVGGQPYLAHRGLRQMATTPLDLDALEAEADLETGIFGDHLRRLSLSLAQDAELCEAVRAVLRGRPCPTSASFCRLRTAGVVKGESARDARPRCRLYAVYLAQRLASIKK
jgi:DNA-binding SARP family transcriptional activator